MNLIVAVAKDWGIGCENQLLFRIPEDQKYFKKTTTGKVVVMGHNTFKSLPGGKPLKDRTNIVLSRDTALSIPGVVVCNSSNLLEYLKNYAPQDIFIIGGAVIYSEFINLCQRAYVTKFDATTPADTFFPNIDEMPNWKLVDESAKKEHDGLVYKFCVYENVLFKY